MKGDDLPEDDHVVRYVKPSAIQEDGTVDGSEFRLRPHRPDETGVSVNWLECFAPDIDNQMQEVRRRYRLKVRAAGRFAQLNIGAIKRHLAEVIDTVRVVHDPLAAEDGFEEDQSHSEITGLPQGASDQAALIGDMIAECICAVHPAVIDPKD
jgi:hypothetical protein